MSVELIVTHPGGSHKDDFLACCLLVAETGAPVVRRDPTEEELDDVSICVVDVGHRHEPEKMNFDHHQFPRDHEPICALSLVLKWLGVYDDARLFCDWLEPAEWFDTRGPARTAEFLGVSRKVVAQMNSPIDVTVQRQFAGQVRHEKGGLIYELMRVIGTDLLGYLRGVRAKLDLVAEHCERWTFERNGTEFEALFLPKGDEAVEDASGTMFRYIQLQGLNDKIAVLVYPDTRGEGYGMARFEDHPRVDFKRIESMEDVHFTHTSGFLAKTTAVEKARLQELVALGWE